jgi:hypothetical protein
VKKNRKWLKEPIRKGLVRMVRIFKNPVPVMPYSSGFYTIGLACNSVDNHIWNVYEHIDTKQRKYGTYSERLVNYKIKKPRNARLMKKLLTKELKDPVANFLYNGWSPNSIAELFNDKDWVKNI